MYLCTVMTLIWCFEKKQNTTGSVSHNSRQANSIEKPNDGSIWVFH